MDLSLVLNTSRTAPTPTTAPIVAPTTRSSVTPPSSTHQTTRSDRIQIKALRDAKLTYDQIFSHFNGRYSYRQIQYASTHPETPAKRRAHTKHPLTPEQIDRLVNWIESSRIRNPRKIARVDIQQRLGFSCGRRAIVSALAMARQQRLEVEIETEIARLRRREYRTPESRPGQEKGKWSGIRRRANSI